MAVEQAGTLPDMVALHAWRIPQARCFVCEEVGITWREFDIETAAIAARLFESLGNAQVRVALLTEDPLAFVKTFFAIVRAGLVAVPLPLDYRSESSRALIDDSGADLVIADGDKLGLFGTYAPKRLLSVHDVLSSAGSSDHIRSQEQAPDTCRVAIDPDWSMSIIYSSGTTSQPKGVVHTHAARFHASRENVEGAGLGCEMKSLISAPLYTTRSLSRICTTLYAGGASILLRNCDIGSILGAAQRTRPNSVDFTPAQLAMLMQDENLDSGALDGCDSIMCGGANLSADLAEQLYARFPRSFMQVYGSTEADAIAALPPNDFRKRQGSVGRPPSDVEICILGERDEVVANGMPGEVAVHSQRLMRGYHNRAEATKNSFWIDRASGKRFYRTGDLGRQDDEGYLWIIGRKDDVIHSGGLNIFPVDIEAVLLQHPKVKGAAVIGIAHDILGETPIAFVVLKEALAESAGEICKWANARLNRNQRVYSVRIVGELPRNVGGKVLKRGLLNCEEAHVA